MEQAHVVGDHMIALDIDNVPYRIIWVMQMGKHECCGIALGNVEYPSAILAHMINLPAFDGHSRNTYLLGQA